MKHKELLCIVLILIFIYIFYSKRVEGFTATEGGFFQWLLKLIFPQPNLTGEEDPSSPSSPPSSSACKWKPRWSWDRLKIDDRSSKFSHKGLKFKKRIIHIFNNLQEECKITKESFTKLGISDQAAKWLIYALGLGEPVTREGFIHKINHLSNPIPGRKETDFWFHEIQDNITEKDKELYGERLSWMQEKLDKVLPELVSAVIYIWVGGGKKIDKRSDLIAAIPMDIPKWSKLLVDSELRFIFKLFDTNNDKIISFSEFRFTKIKREDIKTMAGSLLSKIPRTILKKYESNIGLNIKNIEKQIDSFYNEIERLHDQEGNGLYVEMIGEKLLEKHKYKVEKVNKINKEMYLQDGGEEYKDILERYEMNEPLCYAKNNPFHISWCIDLFSDSKEMCNSNFLRHRNRKTYVLLC